MLEQARFVYLNEVKRKQFQESLLNDNGVRDAMALATVEPYIYRHPTTEEPTITPSRHWNLIVPSCRREDGHQRHAFRAALWVNKTAKAQAVAVQSHDIVAASR